MVGDGVEISCTNKIEVKLQALKQKDHTERTHSNSNCIAYFLFKTEQSRDEDKRCTTRLYMCFVSCVVQLDNLLLTFLRECALNKMIFNFSQLARVEVVTPCYVGYIIVFVRVSPKMCTLSIYLIVWSIISAI